MRRCGHSPPNGNKLSLERGGTSVIYCLCRNILPSAGIAF